MKVRAEIRSGHSLRANHLLPDIASELQKSIRLKLLVFFFFFLIKQREADNCEKEFLILILV